MARTVRPTIAGAALLAVLLACAARTAVAGGDDGATPLASATKLGGGGSGGILSTVFPAGLPGLASDFPNNFLGAPYTPRSAKGPYYKGVYEHVLCTPDEVVRPTSTAELASAVQSLVARARSEGRQLKMRPARDGFASMASFPCSEQPSDPDAAATLEALGGASKPPLVVAALLDDMNKVLSVDATRHQMRVQGQITLKEFYEAATANGMSVPRSSLPWWQGLTLGGAMSTASHGTGFNVTSMICDWTINVTWVDGTGATHTSPKGSPEVTALCGGIGLLGVITEISLQLTPTTDTLLSTWYMRDDSDIANDVEKMLKITPHLIVMWRPDLGKYTGHMQRPAPPGAPVLTDAKCNVIATLPDFTAARLGAGLRAWQGDPFNKDSVYLTSGDALTCAAGVQYGVGAPWATRPGVGSALGLDTPVLEGVAPTNQVTSTDCGDHCPFTAPAMQAAGLDVEFGFEKARLAEWVADIKALIREDLRGLPGIWASTRCLMPGYYVMRFGRTADSLLGMAAGLKEPVYVQQQMLGSKNTPGIPSRYEWVQDTYEQLMLCKYNGHPHFGKNWDRTFTNPNCPLAPRYGNNTAVMAAMQDQYDPQRVFEPELYARAVRGEKFFQKPRCQLDRSCYCEADEHCADGFECVPSIAFPQFKACRPKAMN